jgi:AcrR family transcriptional regulator
MADKQPALRATAAGGQLPPGRHKHSREFVVRSQRDRMLDAMAQICAAQGYGGATAEAVIARAGVSSKTFYEQFTAREDCFLAAYDAILAQFLGRVTAAYVQTELEWPDRVRAAIEALLAFLASEPAFARMCVVEVLTVGERALERYDAAIAVLAGLLDEGRALTRAADGLRAGTAVDVVEGSAFLIREQILAGRTQQLETLVPDLTYAALVPYLGQRQALRHASRSWSTSMAKPTTLPGPADGIKAPTCKRAEPPTTTRERQQRWREQAQQARRERILEAMIDTAAERGYRNTSLSDISARAGVGRDTLRQQFGDKERLFIAAHDWLLERLANYVVPAYQQPGPWSERISRGLRALLTAIAYRPQGARVAIIEVLAAGPRAHERHLAAIETFTPYLDQGRDQTPLGHKLPPRLATVVAGGIAARIHQQVATGHTSELDQLHPELLHHILVSYLGRRQAQQHLTRARSTAE